MGGIESKYNHRHKSHKHYKNRTSRIPKCQHQNKIFEPLDTSKRKSSAEGNEVKLPYINLNSSKSDIHGSILNHSFPVHRAYSENQIICYEPFDVNLTKNSSELYHSNELYDYQKYMKRVDEEHRPVLEELCPDKMYVSTNDLRICDTQKFPPPMRCEMVQGFFRQISPPEFSVKNKAISSSYL